MPKIKVGVIGGTGYTGVELLRILVRHPDVSVDVITSRSEAGRRVSDLYASLDGVTDLEFVDPQSADLESCDVVFSAAPNGVAMKHAEHLLEKGVRLIDLSADFRIRDVSSWEKWYGMSHSCPQLLDEAVYGLTEYNRDAVKTARLLANPGCYPTSVQLGLLPLVQSGIVDTQTLVADCKSGVSGAGRKADVGTAFSELSDSFKAYAASGHRHLPEIVQGLELFAQNPVELVFTPHLLPLIRGIHATLYARLNDKGLSLSNEELQAIFERQYVDEPFVHMLGWGGHPDTRSVRGSNNCRIAVHRPQDGPVVVVLAVEDNLVKGAAGQAVQNMNLMTGLPETRALEAVALFP